MIRRKAEVGDWIVGLSSKALGHKIVYAMRVDEITPFAAYFQEERFKDKIPDFSKKAEIYRCGDNIYKPLSNGGYKQLRSRHSQPCREDPKNKARDLSGINVLVSSKFYYFGSQGPELPIELDDLKVGRGHKNRFSQETVQCFLHFITSIKEGIHAPPAKWPADDDSWTLGIQ